MKYTQYAWKQRITTEDGEERFITPWGNSWKYEHPFDYLFASPEDATVFLAEYGDNVVEEAKGNGWVLVQITYESTIISAQDVEVNERV